MPYQIKNGIIYSGNAVTLTQAQYDALTTAEKNNGTVYYIYDSDAMIEAQEVGLDGGNVETLAGSVATFESSPATATHAVGDYILWNGQLYTVTAAIAVGETLTVDTNIEATSVGAELTSLNNGLMNLGDVFSYEERKVGTWVNGKPLYRKTVFRSSLPNSTTTNYQHGIANVDDIFLDSSHSFIRWSSGSTASLPYLSTSYSSAVDVNSISDTTYTVNTHGTDRSALSGYFTFLYTKTTD